MSVYTDFKNKVLTGNNGQPMRVGDGECVSLVINNSNAYCEALFPGVSWPSIMAPVQSARQLAGKSNQYLTWVPNDHNNPNQVPPQGAIAVFDYTPQKGYSNTYDNPDGHTGIIDSASPNGYVLLQQNAPAFGALVNVTSYPWRFRPCLGWYVPTGTAVETPPAPAVQAHTVYLPPTTGPWHLYNVDGPYVPSAAKGLLVPAQFGGLTYDIVADKGNGVLVINTQMFGRGAIWTKGSDVVIK